MGLLRTLLIILLVYYGIKILTRLLAPYFINYMGKKMQDRYGQYQNQTRQQRNPDRKVGETVIDKMPEQDKSSNNDVGEYIDYEEVKE